MQVYELTYPFSLPREGMPGKQVMAIGDFDGLHLGHREVIGRAIGTAERLGLPASVMTFHPHPREVLGLPNYREVLTPLEVKLALLANLGVKYTYVLSFDRTFSELSPDDFVQQVLIPLGVESVIVGFDFKFGHKGSGNADSLARLGGGQFAVEIVRPYHKDGAKVSSTSIRGLLREGDVTEVERLLGRPYAVRGIVVAGEKRGRKLGFPTANIEPEGPFVIPARGVYAVRAEVRGRIVDGVMNIGVKPTFAPDEVKETLEAHLLHFDDTIYGERISVEFAAFIRPEKRFSSIDELIRQIGQDARQAEELLRTQAERK